MIFMNLNSHNKKVKGLSYYNSTNNCYDDGSLGGTSGCVILPPPALVILPPPALVILPPPALVILPPPALVILPPPAFVILAPPSLVILPPPALVILPPPALVILPPPALVILPPPACARASLPVYNAIVKNPVNNIDAVITNGICLYIKILTHKKYIRVVSNLFIYDVMMSYTLMSSFIS